MTDFNQQAYDFLAIIKRVSKSEMIKRFDLTAHGEMLILVHLYHHQGEKQPPNEIAKATHTSPARVSAILKSLERKDYIKRDINLVDRRKVFVEITEKGKEKAIFEKDKALERMTAIFLKMGQANVEALISSVQSFLDKGTEIYLKEKEKKENG